MKSRLKTVWVRGARKAGLITFLFSSLYNYVHTYAFNATQHSGRNCPRVRRMTPSSEKKQGYKGELADSGTGRTRRRGLAPSPWILRARTWPASRASEAREVRSLVSRRVRFPFLAVIAAFIGPSEAPASCPRAGSETVRCLLRCLLLAGP